MPPPGISHNGSYRSRRNYRRSEATDTDKVFRGPRASRYASFGSDRARLACHTEDAVRLRTQTHRAGMLCHSLPQVTRTLQRVPRPAIRCPSGQYPLGSVGLPRCKVRVYAFVPRHAVQPGPHGEGCVASLQRGKHRSRVPRIGRCSAAYH